VGQTESVVNHIAEVDMRTKLNTVDKVEIQTLQDNYIEKLIARAEKQSWL
jgi:hypothetical protein